jgi:hypothetical protein
MHQWNKLFDRFDEFVARSAKRFQRTHLLAAVILLPTLIALVLPPLIFGKSIFSFVPNSSDEIVYWREMKTYVDYGFDGGQYSTNEEPARFAASPFGSHGPVFAIVYGTVGKLFGWHENSAIAIHLLLIPLALLATVKLAAPDRKQTFVLAALLATWWPLQLYIPSNMQEVLHMCLAILLAALFFRYFKAKKEKPKLAAIIAALLLFGLPFRFIWGFLFFPLALFFPEKRTWRSWLLATLVTGIVVLAGLAFVQIFYSPYPWFSSELLTTAQTSLQSALADLAHHFIDSARSFISPAQGLFLVILVRYQVLGLIAASLLWLRDAFRNRKKKASADIVEPGFHLFNLAPIFLFVLIFYDVLDTRDYRMFIAPLLMSALLFVFFNRMKLAYAIIVFNLIFLVPFLSYYAQFRQPNFLYDETLAEEFAGQINSQLQFDGDQSRWCNTISVSKFGAFNPLSYPIAGVHSGFGITTILDWKDFRDRPLMAKYVLLDPTYTEPGFGNPVNRFDLIELAQTQLGSLYLNPRAPCSD